MTKNSNDYTILNAFSKIVAKYSSRPALGWVGEDPLTYGEVSVMINEVQLILKRQGIDKGDKIVILSENSPNWGIAYLAITTLGAVAVPVLTDFHANEIIHIIRHSGSKAIFVSQKFLEKIEDHKSEFLDTVILIDDFSLIPFKEDKEIFKKLYNDGKKEINRLKKTAMQMAGITSANVDENDLAAIVYTSGTTGNSKGVMLTNKNIIFDAVNTLAIQDVTYTDRLLSVLPLSHTYECTIGFLIPMITGASIYYLRKPPTGSVLIPAMALIRPTMILTVPLIIEKIFKTKIYPELTKNHLRKYLYKIPFVRKALHFVAGRKLFKTFGGKLHFFGIGGALLSADVERFLREAKFPYAIGYGLTETSPLIAGCAPSITKFRSTGPVIPNISVRIADPDENGEGEIQVKGDNVMLGYYKDPDRTKEVFTTDKYFKTGDLGVIKNRYLYIKGRIKNVIVGPSGENIYPEEIESIINEHDLVLESLVYESEGKIVAKVYLNYEIIDSEINIGHRYGKEVEAKIKSILSDIRNFANSKVSQFSKIKKITEQAEPFEKTPTKKIKRYLYTN
ncbi:MAG: AMP-binding protein [Candidatus Cloacimonetes bacterium]|nr:AMP-binding protein [Candidatus Cloacimonadota bacterium]